MNSAAKAWLFLALSSAAMIIVGHELGGREGVLWAVVIALSINSVIYFYGDSQATVRFHGRRLAGQDPWGVLKLTRELSQVARVPMPKVLVVNDSTPQALSVGRSLSSGVIIVTQGLLDSLSKQELKAVLAYQMACIQRQDTFLYSVVSAVSGFVLAVAGAMDTIFRWLIGSKKKSGTSQSHLFTYLVAPPVAFFLKLAITPQSYYSADALAAKYIGDPEHLAKVLWKLQSYTATQPLSSPPSIAPAFVVSPLTNSGVNRYFCPHPPVEKRIERLVGHYPV